jgi:DNA primase
LIKIHHLISRETIQTILETARIDEVVGDFVSLKKRGVNLLGLCPFHNEKTPSFTVSPAKGIFKCFGCGKAGNAVNFIMEHEHSSYPEALKYLAHKYQIEIEEKEQTPEEIKLLNERETLLHITDFAQKHFSENLFNSEEGKAIGLTYFKERGFFSETIRKFQLGYSPEKWDELSDAALKSGYKEDNLVKTGLSIKKDDGSLYDRFRARVIFPIHNLSGKVIGFTSRILSADPNKPKYVNSPESEIYNKSKTLYGIFFAKNAIVANENCFLVEGNTDVISLFQGGIENVVASSGTSLTSEQIKLIKRYTYNITILYDGDKAGIKASIRGVDMILEEGMNVKVVLFPEGEDPDSFARKNSPAELKKYIAENATDFIHFKVKLLADEVANDPIKKAGLIKEIVSSIALIPDTITRSIYVKECHHLLDVSEQILINEVNKLLRNKFKKETDTKPELLPEPTEFEAETQVETDDLGSESQEYHIVELLLTFGNKEVTLGFTDEGGESAEVKEPVAKIIIDSLKEDEIIFANPLYQQLIDEYSNCLSNDIVPDEKHFIYHENPEISKLAVETLSAQYHISTNWFGRHKIFIASNNDDDNIVLNKDIEKSVLSLKIKIIERIRRQLQQEIKAAQENNDYDEAILLTVKDNDYNKIYRAINEKLGRIITK